MFEICNKGSFVGFMKGGVTVMSEIRLIKYKKFLFILKTSPMNESELAVTLIFIVLDDIGKINSYIEICLHYCSILSWLGNSKVTKVHPTLHG